jgi:integrase
MTDNVIFELRKKGQSLIDAGNTSYGGSFLAAAESLSRFAKRKSALRFSSITGGFLSEYEAWMLKFGKVHRFDKIGTPASPTTVGFYLRCLRSAFNDAISAKVIRKEAYPFGTDYKIPSSVSRRVPLTSEQVKQIMEFKCRNQIQQIGRDFWLFIYLCNGINPKDILNLRVRDIDVVNMTFSFVREKTKSVRKGRQSRVEGVLFPQTLEVIDRWGVIGGKPVDYLFPFLNHKMTLTEKDIRKNYFVKQINEGIRAVCSDLGIEADVTSYVARHSFANRMIEAGTPIAYVSQALGHAKISTTEGYVGRLSTEKSRAYLQSLLLT